MKQTPGWTTVSEYCLDNIAYDSDDERKLKDSLINHLKQGLATSAFGVDVGASGVNTVPLSKDTFKSNRVYLYIIQYRIGTMTYTKLLNIQLQLQFIINQLHIMQSFINSSIKLLFLILVIDLK